MPNEPKYTTPCDGCLTVPVELQFQVWDSGLYRDYVDSDFTSMCSSCLTPAVGSTTWDGKLKLALLNAVGDPEGRLESFSCFYRPPERVHVINNRQILFFSDIQLFRSSRDNSISDAWERGFCYTNAGVWILSVACHGHSDCEEELDQHVIWRAHSPEATPESVFTYVQGCTDSIPRGRMVAI